eukprot:6194803-Pleurochrysis_carterae.AAC.1
MIYQKAPLKGQAIGVRSLLVQVIAPRTYVGRAGGPAPPPPIADSVTGSTTQHTGQHKGRTPQKRTYIPNTGNVASSHRRTQSTRSYAHARWRASRIWRGGTEVARSPVLGLEGSIGPSEPIGPTSVGTLGFVEDTDDAEAQGRASGISS